LLTRRVPLRKTVAVFQSAEGVNETTSTSTPAAVTSAALILPRATPVNVIVVSLITLSVPICYNKKSA